MPPRDNTLTAKIKNRWQRLLQFGTWVMAVLASFILTPPIWDFKEDAVWFRFSHFIVAALAGLLFLPISKWSARKYRSKWWAFTAVCLALGTAVFFLYQSLRAAWTTAYHDSRIIIGRTYTQDAVDYKAKELADNKRNIPDEDLVMDYAGDTKSIWKEEEIHQRRLLLAGVYVALISLFALGVMALIQTF